MTEPRRRAEDTPVTFRELSATLTALDQQWADRTDAMGSRVQSAIDSLSQSLGLVDKTLAVVQTVVNQHGDQLAAHVAQHRSAETQHISSRQWSITTLLAAGALIAALINAFHFHF